MVGTIVGSALIEKCQRKQGKAFLFARFEALALTASSMLLAAIIKKEDALQPDSQNNKYFRTAENMPSGIPIICVTFLISRKTFIIWPSVREMLWPLIEGLSSESVESVDGRQKDELPRHQAMRWWW